MHTLGRQVDCHWQPPQPSVGVRLQSLHDSANAPIVTYPTVQDYIITMVGPSPFVTHGLAVREGFHKKPMDSPEPGSNTRSVEIIMFEPFFDQYLPSVTFNGGKPVYVPLHPPTGSSKKPTSNEWTIDLAELRCTMSVRYL